VQIFWDGGCTVLDELVRSTRNCAYKSISASSFGKNRKRSQKQRSNRIAIEVVFYPGSCLPRFICLAPRACYRGFSAPAPEFPYRFAANRTSPALLRDQIRPACFLSRRCRVPRTKLEAAFILGAVVLAMSRPSLPRAAPMGVVFRHSAVAWSSAAR
jgi:hypothetical protein